MVGTEQGIDEIRVGIKAPPLGLSGGGRLCRSTHHGGGCRCQERRRDYQCHRPDQKSMGGILAKYTSCAVSQLNMPHCRGDDLHGDQPADGPPQPKRMRRRFDHGEIEDRPRPVPKASRMTDQRCDYKCASNHCGPRHTRQVCLILVSQAGLKVSGRKVHCFPYCFVLL